MKTNASRPNDAPPRRGMLLLLVLSVLALFVVVGAAGIIMAIRAREAARAFAAAAAGQSASTALARAQLDAALLKLIRGPSASGAAAWGRDVTESLLEDKYGSSQTCTVTSVTGTTGGYFSAATGTVTVTGLDLSNPAAVAGRILTFVPRSDDPTGPTSYRILRSNMGATTTTGTLLLANVKQSTPLPLPAPVNSGTPCEAVINGREFSGTLATDKHEPYDAFDDPLYENPTGPFRQRLNPFLTVVGAPVIVNSGTQVPPVVDVTSGIVTITGSNVTLSGTLLPTPPATSGTYAVWPLLARSGVPAVLGPAFAPRIPDPTATPSLYPQPTVDNDGDGVLDGVWLQDVLPPQRTSEGYELRFEVSYLVLDLDGRINLNAHGSFVRAQKSAAWPADYSRDPRPYVTGTAIDPRSGLPMLDSTTLLPIVTTVSNTNCVPVGMGYGPADVDASLLVSSTFEVLTGTVPARWQLLLQGGTIPTGTSALTSGSAQWRPTPWPSWPPQEAQPGRYTMTGTNGMAAASATAWPGSGTSVASAPTTGTNQLNADYWMVNPVPDSPTDLRAQLQMFTDGTTGTPTLVFARSGTSPWTAVTGTDDVRVSGSNAHPYSLRLDEDAPRGSWWYGNDAIFTLGELERILRPFDSDATQLDPRLAAMLDDLAERSRMTVTTDSWDTPAITGSAAIQTGTSVTGGNAYSVHSPEVVAGLRFNLNRPLTSGSARQEYFRQMYTLVRSLTGTTPAAAAQWAANVIEFRDPDSTMTWYPYDTNPLDGVWTTGTGVWGAERPEMIITQTATSGGVATVTLYRPWVAQLRTGTSGTATGMTERIDANLGDQAANTLNAAKLAGTSASAVWRLRIVGGGTTTFSTDTVLKSGTAVVTNTTVGTGTVAIGSGTLVELQRLADPTAAENAALASGSNQYVTIHSRSISTTGSDSVKRWLHWPNRDLVSHGELLAVQSGSTPDLATVLTDTTANATSEQSLARFFPLLLDATIVPSRFAGANVSVASGSTQLASVGMQNFQHSQFSRWREAGRVNVNTILTNHGNTSVAFDNAVWTALLGRSGTFNPVGLQIVATSMSGGTPSVPIVTSTVATYNPIQTDGSLLVSNTTPADPGRADARLIRLGSDVNSAFLKRSAAVRLANVATPRSHVFAVWITLKITDTSPTAGAPRIARLFAIVDRSIPVGYAPGRTLNVRETIRLQRYLE